MTATLVVALAVSLFLPLLPELAIAQPADQEVAASGPGGPIEEIVVQARRREELLSDTPVSVTAIGEAQLRDNQVNRLEDIATLAPNLNFRNTPNGHDAVVFIRGVGTPRVQNQFDPGVGIYFDGVFLSRLPGSLLDVVDIDQIEVLRGPQGTLFGKNTVGGAILIHPTKPKDEFEASAMVRAGRFDRVDTRLMLNVPLWEDRILSRIAFGTSNHDGYTYNEFRDVNWNDRQALTFLGSLRFLLTDDLTFDLSGTWARSRSRGPGGQCVVVPEGSGGFDSLLPGLNAACSRDRPKLVFDSEIDGFQDVRTYGTWGKFDWDFGQQWIFDDLALKSLSSWREQIPRSRQDTELAPVRGVVLSTLGGSHPTDGDATVTSQISQELQLQGAAWEEKVQFVVGGFGYWEDAKERQGTRALIGGAFPSLAVYSSNAVVTDNWNWAVFGQVTVDPLEWLSLTGGGRFTQEKKFLSVNQDFYFEDGSPNTSRDDPPLRSNSRKFEADTWMASVVLKTPDSILDSTPIDRFNTYFTFSQGFRGGGFNSLPDPSLDELESFSPEFADSFEIGIKTEAFDRRFTMNLSLFYMDYSDIQVTTIQNVGDIDGNGVDDIFQRTVNAASGTSKGIELETIIAPLDGLLITGNFALLDTDFDDFGGGCVPDPNMEGLNGDMECPVNDLTNEPIDRSGQSFNNAPGLTSYLAVQYTIPIDFPSSEVLIGSLTPMVNWSYTGGFHFFGPELEETNQNGYNLLNARLAYRFHEDRAEIALWGRNLLDKRYKTMASPLATTFGTATQLYAEPLTFGGEVSYHFN